MQTQQWRSNKRLCITMATTFSLYFIASRVLPMMRIKMKHTFQAPHENFELTVAVSMRPNASCFKGLVSRRKDICGEGITTG